MRLAYLTVAGGMIGVMLAATTFAQGPVPSDMRQPNSVQRTAYANDYLYFAPENGGTATATDKQAPPAPATTEATPTAPAQSVTADACTGCENCGCSGCRERRWGLNCAAATSAIPGQCPSLTFLAERRVTVGGWVEAGMYTNQYDVDFNGPVGMRPNKFLNLNQLNGYAERIARQDGCEWDFGGRIDYMFGTDGPLTQAFGDRTWDYGWNSSTFGGQPLYGSAIPQAYADVTYGNFKLRAGHFYTPIGYETVAATGNFFYSHSYVHTYGEPFTNTGVLASQRMNEKLTVYAGWVDGWDGGFENKNDASMFLGGLTYKLSERLNLAWYCTFGYNGDGYAFLNPQGLPAAPQGNLIRTEPRADLQHHRSLDLRVPDRLRRQLQPGHRRRRSGTA